MLRKILKSKLHGITVTNANLNYKGSITIDENLMKLADILKNEQVQVVNINNGERFETYVIPGKEKEICLNGAAARLVQPGDKIIVMSYGLYQTDPSFNNEPAIFTFDNENNITSF